MYLSKYDKQSNLQENNMIGRMKINNAVKEMNKIIGLGINNKNDVNKTNIGAMIIGK